MNFNFIVLEEAGASLGSSLPMLLVWLVLIGAMMYFMVFRPQKKQQKAQDELMQSIEIGDSVCTTSGFYGVVIDKVDDKVVIVEFGNNKNCRIPMKKTAIIEVEKPFDPNKAAKENAASDDSKKKEQK